MRDDYEESQPEQEQPEDGALTEGMTGNEYGEGFEAPPEGEAPPEDPNAKDEEDEAADVQQMQGPQFDFGLPQAMTQRPAAQPEGDDPFSKHEAVLGEAVGKLGSQGALPGGIDGTKALEVALTVMKACQEHGVTVDQLVQLAKNPGMLGRFAVRRAARLLLGKQGEVIAEMLLGAASEADEETLRRLAEAASVLD